MENAATACLMSELWFGRMDGVRDAVLITVSEGIGAGILANGQLISGQRGMAGEFGHIPLIPPVLAALVNRTDAGRFSDPVMPPYVITPSQNQRRNT
jgi:hypothetical protein